MINHKLTNDLKVICLKSLNQFPLNKSFYCPFCNMEIKEEIRFKLSEILIKRRVFLGYKKSDDFILNQSLLNDFIK